MSVQLKCFRACPQFLPLVEVSDAKTVCMVWESG